MTIEPFDVEACRKQFPALSHTVSDRQAVFFDGPAGSQVPRSVIDAVSHCLTHTNANCHGKFTTSREVDAMLESAAAAMADLFGVDDPAPIIFGANMTSLTFALSRALARTWQSGSEVIVTRLDHDANVTPWVLAARDSGAAVRQIGIRSEDCTLDLKDLESQLSGRTRLVAVGAASNSSGSINEVRKIADMAHACGAEVYVDAVHYAPHGLIDAVAWDADYVVASAYKFFGPHVGILWGRRARLERLEAYKVRPASNRLPDKWMNGTQNHEGIAGALAAVDYLADLGWRNAPQSAERRDALVAAMHAIRVYEQALAARLLDGLAQLPEIKIWGITDCERLDERVPTISFTHQKLTPEQIATRLGACGIFVWHGNYYALALSEALGHEPDGMVRVGLLHYNTAQEVDRLLEELSLL